MDILTSILIAIGLAMDAFAVSLGIGTTGEARSIRPIFRLSFHMGLFQGLMAFLGWLAGSNIATYIASFDHWVAMILLGFVGTRMIRSSLHPDETARKDDPSRGSILIIISIATSIDAFAVGLSLAMLNVQIVQPSLVIGVVTLALSLAGLLAGGQLGIHFGRRMELLGGLILNGIGVRILLTHVFGWV